MQAPMEIVAKKIRMVSSSRAWMEMIAKSRGMMVMLGKVPDGQLVQRDAKAELDEEPVEEDREVVPDRVQGEVTRLSRDHQVLEVQGVELVHQAQPRERSSRNDGSSH